jgi:hypothetical protein
MGAANFDLLDFHGNHVLQNECGLHLVAVDFLTLVKSIDVWEKIKGGGMRPFCESIETVGPSMIVL